MAYGDGIFEALAGTMREANYKSWFGEKGWRASSCSDHRLSGKLFFFLGFPEPVAVAKTRARYITMAATASFVSELASVLGASLLPQIIRAKEKGTRRSSPCVRA